MSVLVLVEHADGVVDRISAETFALARDQGEVRAVLFGSAEGVAADLGRHGVDVATVVAIDVYAPMAWAASFEQVARSSALLPDGFRRGSALRTPHSNTRFDGQDCQRFFCKYGKLR